jgi:hypothetical protein
MLLRSLHIAHDLNLDAIYQQTSQVTAAVFTLQEGHRVHHVGLEQGLDTVGVISIGFDVQVSHSQGHTVQG